MSGNILGSSSSQLGHEEDGGVGMPGIDLLDIEDGHLLSPDLTVTRNAKGNLPERHEGGWHATGFYCDENTGDVYVTVEGPGDGTLVPTKTLWLDDLKATNPSPYVFESDSDDTIPSESSDAPKGAAPAVASAVAELERGGGKRLLIAAGKLEQGSGKEAPSERGAADAEEHVEEATEKVLADLFSGPDAMARALSDETINPELRQQLGQVISTWKELEAAKATAYLWEEVVAPHLRKTYESLTQTLRDVDVALTLTSSLSQSLRGLEQAIGTRDLARIGEAAQSLQVRHNMAQFIELMRARLSDHRLDPAITQLHIEGEEADNQVRRLHRSDQLSLSADEAAELIGKYGGAVRSGATTAAVTRQIGEELQHLLANNPTWRHRKEVVETVVGLGRAGERSLPQDIARICHELEEIRVEMQRGRFDADAVGDMAYRKLRQLTEDLENARKYLLMARQYAEQAR